MASLSTFGANALLNGTALPEPLYVQLHVGDPGAEGLDNPATDDTRVGVNRTVATEGSAVSEANIDWPDYPATEDITHVSIWDFTDNCWFIGEIEDGPVAAVTGETLRISSGQLTWWFPIWGSAVPTLPAPVIDAVVNPGGNAVTITWPPVDGASNYPVEVIVDGGEPAVLESPIAPEVVLYAPAEGEYEIAVRATGPGGTFSPPSEPVIVDLVETPTYEEGSWWLNDLPPGETVSRIWFATNEGEVLVYSIGFVDPDLVKAFVKYQLNEVGAPTLVETSECDLEGEFFPIKKAGEVLWFVRQDDGGDRYLVRWDMFNDVIIAEVLINSPVGGAAGLAWLVEGQIHENDPLNATDVLLNITEDPAAEEVTVQFLSMSGAFLGPDDLVIADANYMGSTVMVGNYAYVITLRFDGVEFFDRIITPIDFTDIDNPVVRPEVVWAGPAEAKRIASGDTWAIITSTEGIHTWDLTDPAAPVLLDSLDMLVAVGPDYYIEETWQELGRVPVGAGLAARRPDGKIAIQGWLDGDTVRWDALDISTPTARANLAVTLIQEYEYAVAWTPHPVARLGAAQSIGDVLDDNGYTWLTVAGFPPLVEPIVLP